MNPLQAPLFQILRIVAAVRPQLINAMGTTALEFIDDNFSKSGFQGTTFQPWPKRAKAQKGRGRKLLVDTGTLRRSFKQTDGERSTTLSTDIEYAQIHNEGGTINHGARSVILSYRGTKGGKLKLTKRQTDAQKMKITDIRLGNIAAHVVKMPKRQFIGPSPVLSRKCEKAVLTILLAKLPP